MCVVLILYGGFACFVFCKVKEEEEDEIGVVFFFQAEGGIRNFCLSRGLGDVYRRQMP